jgi:hypothetical protein
LEHFEMAANDARPVPRKNAAFRFYFAIRKPSDSTLITTWTGQDSEVSLDGAAFADCTNEATEIGTSGVGYIDLTSSEMNADSVVLKITVTNTGAVPLVFTLCPEEAGDYRVADTQKVDVETIKTQAVTCAAGVTVPSAIASTTNITAGTITTTTNLTNLPAITANWLTAAGIAADAVTEIQSGLATQASVDDLPTNAELATALGTADDAVLAALATVQSDTNDIQTRLPAALESGRIAAVLDSTATAALVDLIWDEPLTKATHNVATSSGKRLRQTTAFQQIDSTVIDASATTTTFVTDLTSAVDDFYNDSMLVFTDGALAGQVRAIYDYVGATKTIVLEEALTSAPVNGVAFAIVSLHIHPVSQIQSGLATASALTAAKTILDKVDTGLVVDGAVYQFTANMLELAPSSGGGAGDASQATLLEVKAKTDLIGTTSGISSLLAASVLTPGTITEFPDTLTIGDSYTTANGRSIQIPIVDTDGNQISSTGSLNFADATATFVIKRAKETDSTRIITGTAAFTDPVGTGTSGAPYAVVQLTSSETAKGLIGYKYSGVLTFTWPYVGTGTDPEVMSFETDTLLFDN